LEIFSEMLTIFRAAMLMTGVAFAQTEPAQPSPPAPSPPSPQQPSSQQPVHVAPSFDCGHAASVVEKEICAIPDFADLDSRIAALFTQAQSIVGPRDAEALRGDQRAWLRDRDACGNRIHGNPPIYVDVYACLRDELNRREGLLRVVVASKQFTKP
jgi:uncharacterized protein YecT (DUF1311 family)